VNVVEPRLTHLNSEPEFFFMFTRKLAIDLPVPVLYILIPVLVEYSVAGQDNFYPDPNPTFKTYQS
jgi:hypothetical protein